MPPAAPRPPILRPFRSGATLGMGVGIAWLGSDALYLAVFGHALVPVAARWAHPAAVIGLHVGLGATLPIFLALWGGVARWGLVRSGLGVRIDERARRLRRRIGERPLTALGWVGICSGVGGVLAAGAVVIATEAFVRVRTPWLAASVALLGALLWAVALATVVPAGLALVKPHVERPVKPEDRQLAGRITVLVAIATVLGIALAILRMDTDVRRALPWIYVVSPAVTGIVVLVMGRSVRKRPRTRLAAVGLPALVVIALGIAAAFPAPPWRSSLRVARRQTGIATAWFSLVHRGLDLDGDGALGAFAEGDCAILDAAVGPDAVDVPGNGVDEDCTGLDAMPLGFPIRTGPKAHPRPRQLALRPHVVLITTDGLTFAETSADSGASWVTPRLGSWATRATVFENAFAPSPTTEASLFALHTGRFFLGRDARAPRAVPIETLAQTLSRLGYRTHAVLGSRHFDEDEYDGVRAGFRVWDTSAEAAARRARGEPAKHSAPEVTERALEALHDASDAPLFLWVHYFDHHAPYLPRPDFPRGEGAGSSARERYLREVAFADRHWGALLEAVETEWEPHEYIALFTADHGEAFDVHHRDLHHGSSLHTAELGVPFIVQTSEGRGRREPGMVALLDVAPTLYNLVGAPPSAHFEGESLVRVLYAGAAPEKTVLYATFVGPALVGTPDPFTAVGVRTAEWYYCREREGQWLSRWRESPIDADLGAEHPRIVESLRGLVTRKRTELSGALR